MNERAIKFSDRPRPAAHVGHLTVGCLIFEQQDQIDFTGPFEVLSRIPDSTVHVIAKTKAQVRDVEGLILTPTTTIAEAPELDLLCVSGGLGQQALMDDQEIQNLIRKQFDSNRLVYSVCTGALLCGAAGILKERMATTHWAAWDLLKYYGAIPIKSRVVVDGNLISAAGVTAGIDGALAIAALLRGDEIAQRIQLAIEYSPEPIFNSGTPESASPSVVDAFYETYAKTKASRETEAQRFAKRNGVSIK
jgi:cyclohexyl-isocyanide hydratase